MLTWRGRPSAGITSAISKFSAEAQLGAAPGAGSGALSISESERRRILEEEQRQLDVLKVLFHCPAVANSYGTRTPDTTHYCHIGIQQQQQTSK